MQAWSNGVTYFLYLGFIHKENNYCCIIKVCLLQSFLKYDL